MFGTWIALRIVKSIKLITNLNANNEMKIRRSVGAVQEIKFI